MDTIKDTANAVVNMVSPKNRLGPSISQSFRSSARQTQRQIHLHGLLNLSKALLHQVGTTMQYSVNSNRHIDPSTTIPVSYTL